MAEQSMLDLPSPTAEPDVLRRWLERARRGDFDDVPAGVLKSAIETVERFLEAAERDR